MARGSAKKSPKTATSSLPVASTTPSPVPPPPFKPAPAALFPFYNTLPKDHVYVTHLESTPPGLRKQTFLVPVILNLMILAALSWRLYYAVPTYIEQMVTILGYDTTYSVNPKTTAWSTIMDIIIYRTFLLSVDYAIFGLLGRWPLEFVFGDKYGRYTGTLGWKRQVGFSRLKEPIVRRGRKWDVPLYAKELERKSRGKPEKSWTKDEELEIHTKCSDALSKAITSKNALSLLDKDWDLDYRAMVDAAQLMDATKISVDDLDHLVLVPWQGTWYSWFPHRTASASGTATATPVLRDEKLEDFREKLHKINADDCFFRYVELVQYESVQPGGFSKSKKLEVEHELRRMLRTKGKDDEALIQSIGGPSNLPGMG